MTLQQLRYLIAIAEYGSINAAAQNLYASQSNLSTAIKELEQELGITVFTRSNRGADERRHRASGLRAPGDRAGRHAGDALRR